MGDDHVLTRTFPQNECAEYMHIIIFPRGSALHQSHYSRSEAETALMNTLIVIFGGWSISFKTWRRSLGETDEPPPLSVTT